MEAWSVVRHEQVAHFMDNRVLDAPFGQEQEIQTETDGLTSRMAGAPSRTGGTVIEKLRTDTHQQGIPLYHRADNSIKTRLCIGSLGTIRKGQPCIEVRTCLFTLQRSRLGTPNPFGMFLYEFVDGAFRRTERSRDMHAPTLHNAQGKATGTT